MLIINLGQAILHLASSNYLKIKLDVDENDFLSECGKK